MNKYSHHSEMQPLVYFQLNRPTKLRKTEAILSFKGKPEKQPPLPPTIPKKKGKKESGNSKKQRDK